MTDVPLRQIGRQPYSVEVPLFPAYVFCKYDAVALHSFWDISGILSMVQGTDGVNIIPEQEITDLRRTLAAGLSVQPAVGGAAVVARAAVRDRGEAGFVPFNCSRRSALSCSMLRCSVSNPSKASSIIRRCDVAISNAPFIAN